MAEFDGYAPGTPNWVDVVWGDHAAAADFYGALFGWTLSDLGPEAGGYGMFMLKGKPVAGLSPKMGEEHPSVWTSYIGTADCEATAAKIAAAGGTLLFGPMQVLDSGKMAVFSAPDGSIAALWEPGAHKGSGLANEPGAFTWNELNTRDEASATAFYQSAFDWGQDKSEMGGHPYTMWSVNGNMVAGMMAMPEEVPAEVPSFWLVYFGVANADQAVATAISKGGELRFGPIDSPAGRLAVLSDPEGAQFAVIQVGESA